MVIEFENFLTCRKLWAVSNLKNWTINQAKRKNQTGQPWRFATCLSYYFWEPSLLSQSCTLLSYFDASTNEAHFLIIERFVRMLASRQHRKNQCRTWIYREISPANIALPASLSRGSKRIRVDRITFVETDPIENKEKYIQEQGMSGFSFTAKHEINENKETFMWKLVNSFLRYSITYQEQRATILSKHCMESRKYWNYSMKSWSILTIFWITKRLCDRNR